MNVKFATSTTTAQHDLPADRRRLAQGGARGRTQIEEDAEPDGAGILPGDGRSVVAVSAVLKIAAEGMLDNGGTKT